MSTLPTNLVFLFNGATLASAADSIIHSCYLLIGGQSLPTIPAFLLFANAMLFTYCCSNLAQITASLEQCTAMTYFANFFGHAFITTFDAFLLFKSWAVCKRDRTVGAILFVALLHRIGWAITDVIKTYSDVQEETCVYNQFPLSLAGFSAADIICDFLASACAIGKNYKNLGDGISSLIEHIFKENIFRSVFVLALNVYMMYASYTVTDGNFLFVFFSIVIFILSRLLNMEFLMIDARKKAAQTKKAESDSPKGRKPSFLTGSEKTDG